MQPRLLLSIALAALAAACSSSTITVVTVDSCTGQTGTCVSLQINDASPSLGAIDGIEVALSGASTARGPAQFPSGVSALPVSLALLLPAAGGSITVTVGAVRSGALVGYGTAHISPTAGQQISATVTLAPACTGATCGANHACVLDSDCPGESCSPTSLTCAAAAGSPSAGTSVLSVPSNVAVGASITATLQAKDGAGNLLTTGGATVVFTTTAGTGAVTVGATTDHGNGTYSAQVTATRAGTAMVSATLNGATLATSATINVTSSGSTPSTATSTVTAPASVSSGESITVTLQTKDGAGNPITSGGAAVVFSASHETGTAAVGSTADHGDGTYSASVTGVLAGLVTLQATLNGSAVTSTAQLTVTTGAASAASSTVTAPTALVSGTTIVVSLHASDAAGNPLSSGGATVAFSVAAGPGTASVGATTDGGNGVYTASVTGILAGALTLQATLNGTLVTSTAQLAISAGSVPSAATSSLSAVSGVASGMSIAISLQAKDPAGNPLTTGGATVVFAAGGAGSATLSSTTDNGDGTYSASLTGVLAGSVTLGATLNGATIAATQAITVTVGTTPSAATSLLNVPSTAAPGTAFQASLEAKDAAGNSFTSGGATVVFTATGTASGTIGQTVDNHNGSYSAAITPGAAGNLTVGATLNGNTLTATVQVTVAPVTPCSITAPTSLVPNTTGNMASVTPVSGLTYAWTITHATFAAPNSGTTATGTSVSFNVGTISPVALTCTASNSGGAQSSPVTQSMTVAPLGTLTLSIAGQDPAYSYTAASVQAGDATLAITAIQGTSSVQASWSSVTVGTLTVPGGGAVGSANTVDYTAPLSIGAPTTQAINVSATGDSPTTTTLTILPYGTWANWSIPRDGTANYTVHGTTAVSDNVTGLVWQQPATPTTYDWSDAVDYCAGLSLGNYTSGWRLPSVIELMSLVDNTQTSQPLINPTYFPSTANATFWTSSPTAFNTDNYWTVYFGYGSPLYNSANTTYNVRCVH